MTSTDRNKPRQATLHVDVGPTLKQAVADAATAAGVRPSDWVRDALQRMLSAPGSMTDPVHHDPVVRFTDPRGSPPWRRDRSTGPSMPADRPSEVQVRGPAAARRRAVTDIRLVPEDVALLDDVVRRAGFRSRAAALRYLLRVLARDAGADAVDALAQLPLTIPALTDSNVALLTLLARMEGVSGPTTAADTAWTAVPPVIDATALRDHVEVVSRVVAALRPLLVIRPVA